MEEWGSSCSSVSQSVIDLVSTINILEISLIKIPISFSFLCIYFAIQVNYWILTIGIIFCKLNVIYNYFSEVFHISLSREKIGGVMYCTQPDVIWPQVGLVQIVKTRSFERKTRIV